jgi:long-subunit acyl-CoA synthetase (AMP-forming)
MSDAKLTLQAVYEHERQRADQPHMTQPTGGGGLEIYTWARTVGEARRVAAYLRSLEFPPGSHVALVSKNCAELIIADLAIWMAGHVSVALFPTLSCKGMALLLEHSEARLAFVGKLDDAATLERALPEGLPCITFSLAPAGVRGKPWRSILAEYAAIPDSPTRPATDVAMIIYTSGSTGQPKGVLHGFGGIAAAGRGLIRALDVTASDRMLSYLPLAHVMERAACETMSLLSGMQLFFAESVDTFLHDLQRARPSLFVSVPRLWLQFQLGALQKFRPLGLDRLLAVPLLGRVLRRKVRSGLGLDRVRWAVSGSASIPEATVRWYHELGLELREGYGMTENFAYSHVSQPGQCRIGYVGRPYADVECRISAEGEVLVKSPANMLGYFKEPEASREAFTDDGFLRTGDRGALDAEGRLRLTGRSKELFKTSKGKYVAPAPIENLLNAHAGIEHCCVLGSGQRAACAVLSLARSVDGAPRSDLGAQLEALLSSVNTQLEEHERLQFLAVAERPWSVETGELTPTLKIRRDTIEQAMLAKLDSWYRSGARVILA